MERDENNIRFYSSVLQNLASTLWGTVLLGCLRHDPVLWRILTVVALFVVITLCNFFVNKLSTRYQHFGDVYQSLIYGIMFGLSPPESQSIYENIEKIDSPFSFQENFLVVFDLFILTIKWKLMNLKKFILGEKKGIDSLCMCVHYSLLLWSGVLNWMLMTFLGSVHIIGYLVFMPVTNAPANRPNMVE
ncbi:unnamed protein product [Orchesella dallaii]|uniref:Reticulon-like protein n=1 Tax=Orchesella dallaii TaxID=48710 RepID=A0ABP1S7N3_9HEXA